MARVTKIRLCEAGSGRDSAQGQRIEGRARLNPIDQVKTAFITLYGACCYRVMCLGLTNAGATYQRCMQKCLHDQIGKNVQVYVDDIVIKTKEKKTLLDDLKGDIREP